MTDFTPPGVYWVLDSVPRAVQLEALSRSYVGVAWRDERGHVPSQRLLPHVGRPASGWGHFLEMRLGKSQVALNEWKMFERDYGFKRAFVLSPNKFKYGWEAEARKAGLVDPIHVFESSNREACQKFLRSTKEGLMVANYESLIYPENTKLFARWINNRAYMVADESIMIKNRNTSSFKAAFDLAKNAGVTRALTGKPVTQGPHDLYSQLRFIRNLDGVNFFAFRNRYCLMGGFQGKQILGARNEEDLRRILNRVAFVARRADWSTHWPPDYDTVELPMMPVQTKAYRQMEQEFQTWVESLGANVSVEQVVTKHLKLQQISSGFIYDDFGVAHRLMDFKDTPKFRDLSDLLENYVSGKAIVIVYYVETARALVSALVQHQPAVLLGNQHMAGRGVEAEKNRFNNDPNCKVLIGQIKAIKYGHNLSGSRFDPCMTTIFFENSYSLDDRAQAEQRNQGVDQSGATFVVDYASSGVEKRIIAALQRKEDVSAKIMGYYKEKSQ